MSQSDMSQPNMSQQGAAADLIFMMGKFEARVPTDRLYAKNHMWAQGAGQGGVVSAGQVGAFKFGFSAYAVRLLQDVYFLEWSIDPGAPLRERQQMGHIESSKAESDLYAPMVGTLEAFNQQLLSDPSHINVDTYGPGWLFSMTGPGDTLLTPQEYLVHLAESWKVAEKTIKGQLNE